MFGSHGPKDSCFVTGMDRMDKEYSTQSDVLYATMLSSHNLETL